MQADEEDMRRLVVAPTLCDFFARLYMESQIHHAHTDAWLAAGVHSPLGCDLYACAHHVPGLFGPVRDADAAWRALQSKLTAAQASYLGKYKKARSSSLSCE